MIERRRRGCYAEGKLTVPALMPSPRLLGIAFTLGLGLVASASLARADSDPAETLFDRGVKELEAGRYEEACPPIEQSYRLDPRPGTLFTLAECEAKRGRIATAVARYDEYLIAHGKLPGAKKSTQADRAKVARRQIDLLKPQLPQLTLVLPPGAPKDAVVLCDGDPVGKDAVGAPMTLDPGAHVITTSAPGVTSSEVRLKLARGQQMRLDLTLGTRTDAAPAAPAAPPVAVAEETSAPSSGRRAGAYIAGGVGLAGLIVGGVLGGLALAQKSVVDANCKPTSDPATLGCHGDGYQASQSLQKFGLWSTVGFGVGAAGVVTAVVLIATEPRQAKKEASARGPRRGDLAPTTASVGLTASPANAMLEIKGAW